MNVTICLCTCQRPALLERLLEKLSTFEWRGLDRHNIHLLVVDNAPLNANRVLVDAFKEGGAAPINASYHENGDEDSFMRATRRSGLLLRVVQI